ncbi:MAG: ATP-grasp domain-containing protein [Candidatus Muirbacterium halophilum]|nr:ATP-grasp domain-containing protein [Candidatus Muirbacterium halophilum]
MRKIFILGGSTLQLDLILEAKKMFFYTIVLDMDEDCIGSKWCDEFLHIDIANKEAVLQKAKEYKIDVVLTSATELGNLTACFVGEKMGLNTNSYQCAQDTTDKILMKDILQKANIQNPRFQIVDDSLKTTWDEFPCIVKPSDSSAGRGLSYCTDKKQFDAAFTKAMKYSSNNKILIEEYIEGVQFSCETITSNTAHQIVAINSEFIHDLPHIMEVSHTIPANIDTITKNLIKDITPKILDAFNIRYGASHIELRVTPKHEVYVIEIASRTGGMRSEMINFAYGINYSQLLLLSSLNNLSKLRFSRYNNVRCNFIIDYDSYKEYLTIKDDKNYIIFEPFKIPQVPKDFEAEHIGESKGYYFILQAKTET